MKLRGEKNNHCYIHCWTTDARFTKFPQALTQFFKTIQLSFLLIYNLNYNENLLFLTCVKPISSPAAHPETQLLTREQKTESAQVILISKNSANFLLEKPCNSSCHKLIHWEFRRKTPWCNKQTSSFLCNHTSSVHSHLISVPSRAAFYFLSRQNNGAFGKPSHPQSGCQGFTHLFILSFQENSDPITSHRESRFLQNSERKKRFYKKAVHALT